MSFQSSVRKRKENATKSLDKESTSLLSAVNLAERRTSIEKVPKKNEAEWDYRIAMAVITLLSFLTRFWGISHPNEVVFDEVHFGKVALNFHNSKFLELIIIYSLHHITYSGLFFSMYIHHSGSFSLH